MNLTKRTSNNFCIVSIEGRIDTTNFNSFEKEINEILGEGVKHIILNCKNLSYISSSGLRVFLLTQKKLMATNDKLYLCEMQSSIKEIFDISGFSTIFRIFNTEQEALDA